MATGPEESTGKLDGVDGLTSGAKRDINVNGCNTSGFQYFFLPEYFASKLNGTLLNTQQDNVLAGRTMRNAHSLYISTNQVYSIAIAVT